MSETRPTVCRLVSAEAQRLFQPELTTLRYVERLLQGRHFEDALIVTANVLPPRDAVWWGCLCAWKTARPEPSEKQAEAFRAALRWLEKPGEPTRRAAEAAAALASDTPAGCIAQAIFFSGGSVSEPKLPAVEPPPGLFAQILLGGLKLAAAQEACPRDSCFHRYVLLAREPLRQLTAVTPASVAADPDVSLTSIWVEKLPPVSAPPETSAAFNPDDSVVEDWVAEPAPPKKRSAAPDSKKDLLDSGMSDLGE